MDLRKKVAKAVAERVLRDKKIILQKVKLEEARKAGLSFSVGNAEVLSQVPEELRKSVKHVLKKKITRSLSGISVVAIMCKPAPCPGECIYCPPVEVYGAPKSYTGFEPACRRAFLNDFDAGKQVRNRLDQFEKIGHETSKCELIVMGGTFNSLPEDYQINFVKEAFDAFNDKKSSSLEEAKKLNEKAVHRVIEFCVETRPDYASETQVSKLIDYGVTRIELGVQVLSDDVLKRVKRGHSVKDVVEATAVCKDSLLKVGYHLMPGLFADKREDLKRFSRVFGEESFRPDFLKIYPCLVIPGTPLYDLWKKGEYFPYSAEEAASVIAEMQKEIPVYCRVMRVGRDIPTNLVASGVMKSNLRELVDKKMREMNWVCRCIRCREVGLRIRDGMKPPSFEEIELKRLDYLASGGKEVFLSFEHPETDSLIAFLRLRFPGEKVFRKELSESVAGVRELRVFGEQVPVGEQVINSFQHKDFGRRLLEEAEFIAKKEWGVEKIVVISGVGAREYYYKRGYFLDGAYVSKKL